MIKCVATILLALLGMAGGAWAQSLLNDGPSVVVASATGLSPYDPPRRLSFKKHDHLQILVSERTRALTSAQLQADHRSRFELDMLNWSRLAGNSGSLPTLTPAHASGLPVANTEARYRMDNTGHTGRQLDLTLNITAEVIDVRPNGTLVVQAMKRHKINDDDETIKLTGEVSPNFIVGDHVRSDNMANLSITYEGTGAVSDLTNPGWLGWLFGKFWPF
jgi:flagellar L-ring protein precursor FlgH